MERIASDTEVKTARDIDESHKPPYQTPSLTSNKSKAFGYDILEDIKLEEKQGKPLTRKLIKSHESSPLPNRGKLPFAVEAKTA